MIISSLVLGIKHLMIKKTKTTIPVRTVNLTKKSLHEKYVQENPENKVSYSTFSKLQPKEVKQAKKKVDMCSICVECEELKQKWAHLLQTSSPDNSRIDQSVIFSSENQPKIIILERTIPCKSNSIELSQQLNVSNCCHTTVDHEQQSPLLKISSESSPVPQVIPSDVLETLKIFQTHTENQQHQRKCFNEQKNKVGEKECVIVLDFKENLRLSCGGQQLKVEKVKIFSQKPKFLFWVQLFIYIQARISKNKVLKKKKEQQKKEQQKKQQKEQQNKQPKKQCQNPRK